MRPRSAPVGVALVVVTLLAACGRAPTPTGPSPRVPDPAAVAARVTASGLASDLDTIAAVAAAGGGTRGTGGRGDAMTVERVVAALEAAGYRPATEPFDTPLFTDPGGSSVGILPAGPAWDDAAHVLPLILGPAGDVEGPVVALGWDPRAVSADGPGCEAGDWAAVPRGAIVLSRPAPCYRRVVLEHAQEAGAAALVTAHPWADPGELRRSTLIDPRGLTIPAVVVPRDVGEALADAAGRGARARVVATGTTRTGSVSSVIAELRGSDPSRVVIVGAHLDSSLEGPGVNDDGTGVAAVLAIARALAGTEPRATVRFAFWAAEETGLHGSAGYVAGLGETERRSIVAYLNADMLGSPNGIPMVYDEAGTAPGSDAIRDRLATALEAAGVPWEPVDLGGSGDELPFSQAGIATGGVFAGASEPLTPAQAGRHGRQAGVPADACYHLACDGRDNVDEALLLTLTRALARVVAELATAPG